MVHLCAYPVHDFLDDALRQLGQWVGCSMVGVGVKMCGTKWEPFSANPLEEGQSQGQGQLIGGCEMVV